MSATLAAALLVVAPQAFKPALEEFVAFKGQRLATTFVALEDALAAGAAASPGRDDPERLKRALYERWKSSGVRYVLLVGDADTLPVRYMVLDRVTAPAFDYAFYPSDLYYADLAERDGSFEDWNAQKEGFHARYFGEVRGEKNKNDPINFDAIDYHPEVAVGRWPVSTLEQVAAVAAKTMRYERELEARAEASPTEQPDAALVMVGGWIDARGACEAWRAKIEPMWRVERRYYSGKEYGVADPSEGEITGLLTRGSDLLLHAGHGNDDRWEGCLSIASMKQLGDQPRLPIVMSAGCSTARFATLPPYEPYEDVSGAQHPGTNAKECFTAPPPPPSHYARGAFNLTGLGEALVCAPDRGAVAYIGCNTGSQPCALTLVEGFVDGIATIPSPRLGDCWNHAIDFYFTKERLATIAPTDSWYPASIFFQGMKFMVFGDPSLPVGRTSWPGSGTHR